MYPLAIEILTLYFPSGSFTKYTLPSSSVISGLTISPNISLTSFPFESNKETCTPFSNFSFSSLTPLEFLSFQTVVTISPKNVRPALALSKFSPFDKYILSVLPVEFTLLAICPSLSLGEKWLYPSGFITLT